MKRIFIVDDSITTLKLAEKSLKNSFTLTLLISGKQFFSALEKNTPDLVLLDIEIPDIDGISILEKMKADPDWAKIPVVFLTSHTETDLVKKGLQAGALDYITKPFDAETLSKRISDLIKE
ncbi:MAG: response regulator [Spirochaetaceae bacterium]|nr:response regulator [Spirochaetaceae bacterium]